MSSLEKVVYNWLGFVFWWKMLVVVHVFSLVVRLNSGHNELDACQPDLQKILKTEEKFVPAAICWHGRKHNDPHPLPIYLLNNNDDNGFPIVGNEATGNLFGPTFPGRGTCVVTKKTTAVVAQVECEPPAVA